MKTFRELQEVMSMADMNKVAGGTDHQRKIAQDRQRKREAKDRGFDPKKPVLADEDPLKKAAPGVKAPTAPTKASAATDPLKKASSSAIVKAEPSSLEQRKPDLRKSQIGKWSQGIKSSPGKLAKRSKSSLTKPDSGVEKVDVKDVTPKKPVHKTNTEYSSLKKPEQQRGQGLIDTMKRKKGKEDKEEKEEKKKKNRLKKLAGTVLRKAKEVTNDRTGISTSGNLEGLTGTQRYD